MIIGFLGKGGSGKSTLATAMVSYLHNKGDIVLALDVDYNMDLSYNLSVPESLRCLGDGAKKEMKKYLNTDDSSAFADIVLRKNDRQSFTLEPVDSFTKTYSIELKPRLRAMSVGPHTDEVLTDKMCSHGLGALLKAYLPLLKLEKNHHVVVDEKAGTDSVSTGIQTGFDFAIVVVEPTVHGIKAGKQIALVLEKSNTPYGFVINKMKDDVCIEEVEQNLGQKPLVHIPFAEDVDSKYIDQLYGCVDQYQKIYGDTRLERSVAKFVYNKNI